MRLLQAAFPGHQGQAVSPVSPFYFLSIFAGILKYLLGVFVSSQTAQKLPETGDFGGLLTTFAVSITGLWKTLKEYFPMD